MTGADLKRQVMAWLGGLARLPQKDRAEIIRSMVYDFITKPSPMLDRLAAELQKAIDSQESGQ
jgi:hypothetical protein